MIKQTIIQYALGIAVVAIPCAFVWGYFSGKDACQIKSDLTTAKAETAQAQSNLQAVQTQTAKANSAGATLATQTQATQIRTQYLTKEVTKYVPTIINGLCIPDPDSVRAWNAANSGIDLAPTVTTERAPALP